MARKSGQSSSESSDAFGVPGGPVHDDHRGINVPSHATSPEDAVRREREAIMRRDYQRSSGGPHQYIPRSDSAHERVIERARAPKRGK